MHRQRFGEILAGLVELTEHDVQEILGDQFGSHRRFGEIALAWGLCEPKDVWKAWWGQLGQEPERVDLASVGIDAQSLDHLPRWLAEALCVIPVRAMDDQIVVAASDESIEGARAELPGRIEKELRFVLANSGQIRQAIWSHYPRPCEERAQIRSFARAG